MARIKIVLSGGPPTYKVMLAQLTNFYITQDLIIQEIVLLGPFHPPLFSGLEIVYLGDSIIL